jgi:glycosyltransferase involved in cell wall biosynthesis
VADNLGWGGRERQLGLLCSNLAATWKPVVWSVDGGDYADVLRDSGVEVRVAGRRHRWDASLYLDFWKTIREVRPDVVHSWGRMASSAAAPVCKGMRIPFIDGSIRNAMPPARKKALVWIDRRLADRVVSNSFAGLKANGISRAKGRVVRNGFDTTRLSAAVEELPASPGQCRVIMTGRMLPQKDFGSFLQAARILANLEPDRWLFAPVGWGGERESLMERNADLVERKAVVFPEGRHEVMGLVRGCHVGVLLTTPKVHAEGLANSIIEYMACGLPVVCSESGGNRELVDDGVSGFVIPAVDPFALVQKLLALREDPDLAREMGERGRQKVLEQLSVQQMVLATIKVYEELCGAR